MLLEQNSSWRQGGQPQAVNLPQDLGEQDSRDRDLSELEGDIAAMGQDLPVELDQLLSEHFQRSVFWFLPYGGLPLRVNYGSPAWTTECPESGAKRKSISSGWMSAFSHKRKSDIQITNPKKCTSSGLTWPA